ncbi:Legume lectin, beta chain, Mn/Ca-binding site protein [Actinidia chinensis var. chinensis]|uniref:non-specific serine/threonine protein kinase n=1 Tax=Actinidia chinensis var. chinensis TaxID=1590841 RepID=A0A2R6S2V3_ACTCC|nr:Legume lectin, beta chain, Mn/Ca-binding site protein [Actinidia chinensis var. chinensis]
MGPAAHIRIAVVLLCLAAATESLKTFHSEYGPFNETHYHTFEVEKPATISNDALQVTPDSAQSGFNLKNQSGRVFLKRAFKLTDPKSDRVASFNSSFLINIFRFDNTTPGEGLAFVVAPDLYLPANSFGEFLGLTNATTDGNTTNRIVAVELDTFKNGFDPDANHIGLDINSVRSVNTTPLTPLGIELAPANEARFHNIWVQYDGVKKSLEVFIARQAEKNGSTPPRPAEPVLRSTLDLRRWVAEDSYFGFSASTGSDHQLNCVLRWNLTVEYFSDDKGSLLKILLGAGVPILVVAVVVAAAVVYYLRKKRMGRSNLNILGALRSLPGTPREFRFRDLKKATNNFDERNKLGQGGYGVVYRGHLQKENLVVAVKWFSRESLKGQDDFLAELTIINRLRHRHLVRLLGWCHKNGKLLLVYDYMPNGSLDKHLFGSADSEPLGWDLRYKVITGVASALQYLHNDYDQRVVHRDLKASNIMLESDFNARLGDFGLARALDNEKTSYAEAEGVLGTLGYIAPECFHTGKATQQSDVYAFGAVLLEVVCGQRPGTKIGGFQFLVDWVWSLHREGRLLDAVDERLRDNYVVEEAQRLLLLGLACSHPIAGERPKTQVIVQIISGSVPVPPVPPFKPAFIWPSMPMTGDNSLATTMDTRSFSTSQFGSEWTPQSAARESFAPYRDNFNSV